MNLIFTISIILAALALLFLYSRWMAKQNLMKGNFLVSSKATSDALTDMEKSEFEAREKRLMENPRYRILRTTLLEEIKRLQSNPCGINQASNKRRIPHPELNMMVEIHSQTTKNVKVTVYPDRFLGSFFRLEGWIEL